MRVNSVVEARDPAFGVDHEDAVGGRLERGAQQRKRLLELLLGALALGDVLHLGEEVVQLAVGAADRGGVQQDRDRLSVSAHVALLGLVGVAVPGAHRVEGLEVAGNVVRVGDVLEVRVQESWRL